MRLHERRGGQGTTGIERIRIEAGPSWDMLGKDALGVAPGASKRAVYARICMENTAPVGVKRVRAFVGW